jgi:hypothetical protein
MGMLDIRRILAALSCTGLLLTIAYSGEKHEGGGFGTGISAEALTAHLEFLADDALEGRFTGTRGNELAAKYIAAQFAAAGLKGGMPGGSYYQKIPLRRTKVLPKATSMVLSGGGRTVKLKYATDFLLFDTHQDNTTGFLSAPVVFVGYGVSAPELNYDDYANIDVKGKIVAVLFLGAPSKFPATVRAYYMNMDVKRKIAEDHGAVGILGIWTLEKMFPWQLILKMAPAHPPMRWLDAQGRIHGQAIWSPLLSPSAAEVLFTGEKYGLAEIFAASEKGEPPRFTTTKTVTVRYQNHHTPVESANVVAMVEGADPELKSEYVVFSTHLDHLGIGLEIDGDAIYNGAVDNASGCAVMLEIARAFSQLPRRPRRSVIFVVVTAEEVGLLGSDYFANNSPVPIEKVVANINFDMVALFVPALRDVIAYGGDHSSLGRTAAQAAVESGFEISPDPFPSQGVFVRSDHYSFVTR